MATVNSIVLVIEKQLVHTSTGNSFGTPHANVLPRLRSSRATLHGLAGQLYAPATFTPQKILALTMLCYSFFIYFQKIDRGLEKLWEIETVITVYTNSHDLRR
jgi:hypothetical protein